MKSKYFLLQILAIATLCTTLTSCRDDDYYDYPGEIYACLTSQTWGYDQDYIDNYGQPAYEAVYFDFYPDGTGTYESYSESSLFPPMQNVINFRWQFTDPSYSVVQLYFQNGTIEYWAIDRISYSYFSSYVYDRNPDRYPVQPMYFQEMWPMY